MAKKKKNQSKPATTKPPEKPASAPAAKTSGQTSSKPLMLIAAIAVPLLLLGALAVWLLTRPQAATTATPAAQTNTVFTGTVGSVDDCRIQPPFTQKLGFGRSTLLSTAERTVKGLILIEPGSVDQPPRTYQHPSWTMAGYLGPNAFDAKGNLYVAPAPRVSLNDNPPEKQNTIYKVDGETGEMSAYITLPVAAPITLRNPYGVMGLAYDCETNSLYATSVAGSTRSDMVGRVFRIDAGTGKITSQLDQLDGIGVSVFNTTQGKRVYVGSARTQDVLSAPLNAQGDFAGVPVVEFSLAGLGPDGNDKARKISFDKANQMMVNGTKFNYNLAPPAAQQRPVTYRYRYDPSTQRWSYVDTNLGVGSLMN